MLSLWIILFVFGGFHFPKVLTAAETYLGPERCAQPSPSGKGKERTCSKSQVEAAIEEAGHTPWTHSPYCVHTGTGKNKLCVHTNASYSLGRGLSIVASQEIVKEFIKAGLLNHTRYDTYPSKEQDKYEAITTPHLGVGLFIKPTKQYRAGDVITVDYPTLIIPSGAVDSISLDVLSDLRWKALLQLPPESRASTRALAKSKDPYMDEIANIFETNAFTHEKAGALHDIIFPEASRMNHNCLPNVFTRTNHSTLAMEVVALRDIHPGEELTHSYLDPMAESSSLERRNKLASGWNFNCQCSICAGHRVAESDSRRRDISKTKQLLEAARGDPAKILQCAMKLLGLYDDEGMILPKAEYYALVAYAYKYMGTKSKALEFAGLAKIHWDVVFGEDSKESAFMMSLQREMDG